MRETAPTKGAVLLPWSVFVGLLFISWNRWVEPFVDSGRELMVPRRVAGGERLYAAVHFHHGPLAPWAGAAVELLTGPSFAARTVLALAIAAAGLEALRRLAVRWLPGTGGPLAVSLAVALAFFLRPGGWAFPFSFDTAIAVASLTGALAVSSGGWPHQPTVSQSALSGRSMVRRIRRRATPPRRPPGRSELVEEKWPIAIVGGVRVTLLGRRRGHG